MSEFGPPELERVLIDALSPVPESTLIDQPDWVQLITPSLREINKNCVMLARLAPEQADARIAEVVQRYRDQGTPFRRERPDPAVRTSDWGPRLRDTRDSGVPCRSSVATVRGEPSERGR